MEGNWSTGIGSYLKATFLRDYCYNALRMVGGFRFRDALILLGWLAYGRGWKVPKSLDNRFGDCLWSKGLLNMDAESAYEFWKYFICDDLSLVSMELNPGGAEEHFQQYESWKGTDWQETVKQWQHDKSVDNFDMWDSNVSYLTWLSKQKRLVS